MMLSKRSAKGFVVFAAITCGLLIAASGQGEYINAIGEGAIAAVVILLLGLLGIKMFWKGEEDEEGPDS